MEIIRYTNKQNVERLKLYEITLTDLITLSRNKKSGMLVEDAVQIKITIEEEI